MEKDLSLLEKKIKYKFKDISLLKLALTHSSFEKTLNNENLEFLGDRVLGLAIAEKLIKDYPSADEGSLDKMLSSLVNRNTCFMVANNLALGDFILLGSTERSSLGNKKKSILSNACESILGAVYRDSDFVIVKKLILELWREHIHNIDRNLIDPKSFLQEWTLKKYKKLPEYKTLSKKGPDHEPIFEIELKFMNYKKAFSKARSIKEAEKLAAESFIQLNKIIQ